MKIPTLPCEWFSYWEFDRARYLYIAPVPPGARFPSNGFYVTDAVYNTCSSIRRVSEHHMVPLPAEVCEMCSVTTRNDVTLRVNGTLLSHNITVKRKISFYIFELFRQFLLP